MPRPVASTQRPATSGSDLPLGIRPLILLWLLVLGAITLAAPSATRTHTWPWSLLTAAWWAAPIILLLVRLSRHTLAPIALPSTLLLGCVLLSVGTVASALSSPFAPASLPRVWPTLGGVALLLLLHHAFRQRCATDNNTPAATSRLIAIAGAVFVLASLIAWWRGQSPLPWHTRNEFPFGHSTYTAGAIVLLFPWLVLRAWRSPSRGRAGWLCIVFLAILVVASTSSRGGALALAFVTAGAAVALLVFARWSRRRKLLLCLALAATGAVLIGTNPRLRELVLRRGWGESAHASNVQRHAMLEAGLQLGAARPLLGWGPGTVSLAYPRVRADLEGGVENVLQLHNTPVQLWASLGASGIAAMLLLLFAVAATALHTPRTPECLAATASLAGYAVVALTDHQLDLPFFNALLVVNAALLTSAASPHSSAPRSHKSSLVLLGAAILLVIIAVPATVRDLRARQVYDRALDASNQGHPDAFLAELERAHAIAPHDPFYLHQQAAQRLRERDTAADPPRRHTLARNAVDLFRRSLAAGAHQELAHFNLGWLLLDLNEPIAAVRHFESAARLVPDKGGVYLGLGLAHLARGDRQAAVRAFALEWLNDPRHATSPAWETTHLNPLADDVRAECTRLLRQLEPHLPAQLQRQIATARWWLAAAIPSPLLRTPTGFNAESSRFFTALATRSSSAPATDHWQIAWQAWKTRAPEAILAAAHGDQLYAAALARRVEQHAADFAAFLVAPVGDVPALIRTYRRQRVGYGVLALHPDGPAFTDTFVIQENRVAADFAAALFPPKGWLPGRFLLALLPPPPR